MVHSLLLLFDVLLVLGAVLALVAAYRFRLRAKAYARAEQLVRAQHQRPRPVIPLVERAVSAPEFHQLKTHRIWHPGDVHLKHPVTPVKPFYH